jgi:hypothetical protein
MTYESNDDASYDLFEQLISKGLEGLPEVMTLLLNEAIKIELSRYISAEPYERTVGRKTYANVYESQLVTLP